MLNVGKALELGLLLASISVVGILLGCVLKLGEGDSVGAMDGAWHRVGTTMHRRGRGSVDVCVGRVEGAKLLLGSREVLGVNDGYSSVELGLSLMVGTGVNVG